MIDQTRKYTYRLIFESLHNGFQRGDLGIAVHIMLAAYNIDICTNYHVKAAVRRSIEPVMWDLIVVRSSVDFVGAECGSL